MVNKNVHGHARGPTSMSMVNGHSRWRPPQSLFETQILLETHVSHFVSTKLEKAWEFKPPTLKRKITWPAIEFDNFNQKVIFPMEHVPSKARLHWNCTGSEFNPKCPIIYVLSDWARKPRCRKCSGRSQYSVIFFSQFYKCLQYPDCFIILLYLHHHSQHKTTQMPEDGQK